MIYCIFNQIEGQHPAYTVAVLAISVTDARQYMRALWRGGKLVSTVTSGNVTADCGAVTDAAGEVLHARLERDWDERE